MSQNTRIAIGPEAAGTTGQCRYTYILHLLIVGACLSCFLLVVLTSNRGFDFLDEAFYLLSFEDRSLTISFTSTFEYLRPFFDLLSGNVVRFRLFGLMLLTVTGAFFAVTFVSVQKRYFGIQYGSRLEKSAAVAFIVLGALVHYYCFIRTPNYNSLIAVASYAVATGLNLILISNGKWQSYPSALVTGVAIGLSFFVKFTAAPIFLFMVMPTVLLIAPGSVQRRLAVAATIIAGVLLWSGIHFTLIQSFPQWLAKFSATFEYLSKLNTMHQSNAVVRYVRELFGVGAQALIICALPLGLILIGLYSQYRPNARHLPKWLTLRACCYGAILSTAAGTVVLGYYGWQFTGEPLLVSYVAWSITLAAITCAVHANRRWSRLAFQRALLVIVVLVCPVASAVGTGNPISVNVMFAMAPLFAALMTLAQMSELKVWAFRPAAVAMAVIAMLAVAQIASGAFHPYGIYTSVFAQNQRVEFGPPGSALRVEPAVAKFIGELQEFGGKQGITPGRDVMVFYDSAGVVYVLRGRSPATASYYPYSLGVLKDLLSTVPVERLRRAFIFYRDRDGAPFVPALPDGMDFEAGHKLVGTVGSSYPFGTFQVWAPVD